MRRTWLAAATLLVASVVWILHEGARDAHPPEPRDARGAPSPPTLRAAAGRTSHVTVQATPTVREDSGAGPEEATKRRVEGTLTIRDGTGNQIPADGYVLEVEVVGARRVESPNVVEGRWSLEVPPSARIRIRRVQEGPRPVVLLEELRERAFRSDEEIELVASRIAPTTLRVRDALSGVELQHVRVLRSSDWDYWNPGHPFGTEEEPEVVFDRAPSPLQVTPWYEDGYWTVEESLMVHSPGYAWGHIDIDHRVGGERILDLVRGGDLQLRLTGQPAGERVRLLILRPGAEDFDAAVDAPLGGRRELRLDALAPGSYVVRADLGGIRTLVETAFDIAVGRTTHVVLDIPRVEQPRPVALEGVLEIPEPWGITKPELHFRLLDTPLLDDGRFEIGTEDLDRVPRRPDRWRFEAGARQPGRYEVEVRACQYRVGVRLDETTGRQMRIVVPPPVRVSIHVVLDETGEDAPIETISWHMPLPKGVNWVSPATELRDASTGRFEFLAPEGAIEVSAGTEELTHPHTLLEVGPSNREHVIRLKPTWVIQVLLRHGERTFPEVVLDAERLDATSGVRRFRWDGGTRVVVDDPGRYRITVHPPPGFQPIEPREVVVAAGRTTRVEIRLRPKR